MPETSPLSLASELGAEPPPTFADLPSDTQARLAALLREARHRQARALSDAVESGLGFIPRPLRGAVTKLVLR